MMSTEANKRVVLNFFAQFSAGKLDAALALMADTATWWVAGKPETFALAGTKTKAQFAELLQGLGTAMPKGLHVTPKGFTAEDDRVAVEAESYGETAGGKIYNNQYHFLFEVRDSKIQAVREYLDTLHAKEVLVDR
jgi:ketosteroid isomerase-like protein